jgi:hypothetical protein
MKKRKTITRKITTSFFPTKRKSGSKGNPFRSERPSEIPEELRSFSEELKAVLQRRGKIDP